MQNDTRLIIDVGTNSILALIVKSGESGISVVSDIKVTTRLGEGLQESGNLSDEAMGRTARAVSEIMSKSKFDSAVMIGTEAVRKAENSSDFVNLLKKECGLDLTVISGKTEAELTFHGALFDLGVSSNVLLVDVGGGSTELIVSKDGGIEDSLSVPLGAMILKEATGTVALESYSSFAEIVFAKELAEFSQDSPGTLIATGGTITSAGAVFKKMREFKASDVHGMRLTAQNLREIGSNFENLSPDNRKSLIPFDPQRADLMLPGMGILLTILGIFKKEEIVVSNGGLRYGAVLKPELVVSY
jgi:exopolyphosphatase/guanosine-5'-triphosphate,3'-diphosphate pyrophosphatase